MRGPRLLTVLLAAAVALSGCGPDSSGQAPNSGASVLLDAPPNAVHSGIYMAIERGYDEALGVSLRVRVPKATTDGVKELTSERADFAILDIHALAAARAAGHDVVGVMALVQTPLAAVLALPQIASPRDLAGRRVGISGMPGAAAVLRSVVSGAGGDPAAVRPTPIGAGGARNLLAGRLAATTGFWDVEGAELQASKPRIREFRVDDYGAPPFPELVLAVTRATLQDRPALVRATVDALARGYEEVLADPDNGVSTMQERVGGLDRTLLARELDAVSPSFTAGPRGFGYLDLSQLKTWARWEQRVGITKHVIDVHLAFDGRYVPPPGRD
jgi:ABC-type nitrate/sulfonate/bicarbonate transport system substrate-binding protein